MSQDTHKLWPKPTSRNIEHTHIPRSSTRCRRTRGFLNSESPASGNRISPRWTNIGCDAGLTWPTR